MICFTTNKLLFWYSTFLFVNPTFTIVVPPPLGSRYQLAVSPTPTPTKFQPCRGNLCLLKSFQAAEIQNLSFSATEHGGGNDIRKPTAKTTRSLKSEQRCWRFSAAIVRVSRRMYTSGNCIPITTVFSTHTRSRGSATPPDPAMIMTSSTSCSQISHMR